MLVLLGIRLSGDSRDNGVILYIQKQAHALQKIYMNVLIYLRLFLNSWKSKVNYFKWKPYILVSIAYILCVFSTYVSPCFK